MAETREALIEAALAEFGDRGLDVPSLDAICARAGYTRGAFYVHFQDREALLEAVMERVFHAFVDSVIASGDSTNDVVETVGRFAAAATAAANREATSILAINLHRVLDACARSPKLRQRFVSLVIAATQRVTALLREGQNAGVLRGDLDPDILGHLLALLAFGILAAADTGVPLRQDELQTLVLRMLMREPH